MNTDNEKITAAERIRLMENEGKGRHAPLSLPEILNLLELLDESEQDYERSLT